MKDNTYLVFVEVRFRSCSDYGGAGASITAVKQNRLRLAAEHYIQRHRINQPCRFDVVLLGPDHPDSTQWIRDAF